MMDCPEETTTEASARLWGVPVGLLRQCMRDTIEPNESATATAEALGITILRDYRQGLEREKMEPINNEKDKAKIEKWLMDKRVMAAVSRANTNAEPHYVGILGVIHNEPTFELDVVRDDGQTEQKIWNQGYCRLATEDETREYWQRRARAAEVALFHERRFAEKERERR